MSEYASWDDVAAAVDDAIMNGEGRVGPYTLEYFFQKHGLVVMHHDRPQNGKEMAAALKPCTIAIAMCEFNGMNPYITCNDGLFQWQKYLDEAEFIAAALNKALAPEGR